MKLLRIFCLLFPIIGIFIAIGCWISGKPDLADEVLFISFAGIFFNIVILLPVIMITRAIFF